MRFEFNLFSMLLIASLGAAYWASLPSTETKAGRVAILTLEPKQISEVELFSKDLEVRAKRRDTDQRFWIEHKKKDTPKGSTSPESQETVERFLGNQKMDEFLAMFAPLQALRVVGKVDLTQLKDYGLDDESNKIIVKSSEKTLKMILGKKSYGTRDQFVLEGDRVLLIDGQGLENFERAQYRIFERRLVAFDFDEVQRATITMGERRKNMVHTQRDKKGQLIWAKEDDPSTAISIYSLLMDRISKLNVAAYTEPTKQDELQQIAPYLEIILEKNDKTRDRLLFKKRTLSDGKIEYFIRSDFLNLHGQLANARMEVIEKDAEQVMHAD